MAPGSTVVLVFAQAATIAAVIAFSGATKGMALRIDVTGRAPLTRNKPDGLTVTRMTSSAANTALPKGDSPARTPDHAMEVTARL